LVRIRTFLEKSRISEREVQYSSMVTMSRVVSKRIIYPAYEWMSGRRILSKLSYLEGSQWWSLEQIKKWQSDRLAELIHHAHDTVPHYRRSFGAAGITPADVRTVADLPRLPLLTKSIIQEYRDGLVSAQFSPKRRISNSTGGSTGTPIRFYQDQQQQDWATANKLRCNGWAGWDFGKRTLRLWGHPQDLRATQTARGKLRGMVLSEHTLDAFRFSSGEMADLADYFRRKKPQIVVAYASMISHFAAYVDERGITDLPPPLGIITSADMLLPQMRTLIEGVLHAEVFDRYGCREVATIAAECREHMGMHVNADRLIVEFIDGADQPCPPGEAGRVVITDLFNYAMPFIRYDIEDIAILAANDCACGRGLPLLEELIGRYADILVTPQGQFVSTSALTTLLPNVPGLQECQLVQKAIDRLQVNVVQRPDYDQRSEAMFHHHLAKHFGPKMSITFRYVDDIPPTTSGKKRFSVSELHGPPYA
jgi:phenylacetate-CoA ligase